MFGEKGSLCDIFELYQEGRIGPRKDQVVSPGQSRSYIQGQISENGLDNTKKGVQRILDTQLKKIETLRKGDKSFDRVTDKSKPHEYTDIHPIALIRLLRSIVSKDNLKDKHDDFSRFSAIEISELERLYEFFKTEDGKQLLHEGIIDVMDLKSESLSVEDVEKLKTLQFSSFRGEVSEIVQKVRRTASFTDSVEESWKSVDGYVRYIRDILIRRYEGEIATLDKSIETLKSLMKRKEYNTLYSGGEIPGDNKTTFEISRVETKIRLSKLYTERAKDNPMKIYIVTGK